MNTKRQPLPPGTLIDFSGEEAVVVSDSGDTKLTVAVDGCHLSWWWTFDGESCTVVSLPSEHIAVDTPL